MAYVGNTATTQGFIPTVDYFSGNNSSTAFTLSRPVASVYQIQVVIDNVPQNPTSAYTVSGNTITFTSAPLSGTNNIYVSYTSPITQLVAPAAGTVGLSQLNATGTASSSTFLRGDNSWASPNLTLQATQTSGFTAVAKNIYPCNTTSAAFTVTLPAAPTAGDQIALIDYAGTFGTNNLTVSANGLKINASTSNATFSTNREAVTLTYIDSTQGWVALSSSYTSGAPFVQPYSASFLVIAGGASGSGTNGGGGGGAGGLLYYGSETPKTPNGSALTLTPGTAYSIVIGAGGASPGAATPSNAGSNTTVSVLSLTAIGGGYGTGGTTNVTGGNGGSGGGACGNSAGGTIAGGSGTSGQGFAGGAGYHNPANFVNGGGGGGSGAVGVSATVTNYPGTYPNGGTGLQYSINGTALYWAGGGGGGGHYLQATAGNGANGGGGGGGGNNNAGTGGSGLNAGSAGTQNASVANGGNAGANTGGGGGGAGGSSGGSGGAGGSGIVIISYAGSQKGTGGTVTSSGGNTIHTFTTSGTYTA